MNAFFGYIRVSTQKQGAQGSSLTEQRSSIEAYAARNGLTITKWYEERTTAAKRGRRGFAEMLAALGRGEARGVVIHKIDRSARNLRDWADLNDLMDQGAQVHFAHDALDLGSRGGRLSADIQAVVAADFIRNLREETRKGFYGRLKQGIYPLSAPIGYLDMGRGRAKAPDPDRAHLVREAFSLYATGEWNFHQLKDEIRKRGLRSRKGRPVSLNGLTTMLNNPFYIGLIHLRKTNEIFQGAHPPLITKVLYDRVQYILRGGKLHGGTRHDYPYRQSIRCSVCGKHLVGETAKGRYVYYRCHEPGHACISEIKIEAMIQAHLNQLALPELDLQDFRDIVAERCQTEAQDKSARMAAQQLRITTCNKRLAALTDALIDGLVDKEMFENRKRLILEERKELTDHLEEINSGHSIAKDVLARFELAKTAHQLYETALPDQKRRIVRAISSNLFATGKNLVVTLQPALKELLKQQDLPECDLHRDKPRTRAIRVFELLTKITMDEKFRRPADSSLQRPQRPEVQPANDDAAGLQEAA